MSEPNEGPWKVALTIGGYEVCTTIKYARRPFDDYHEAQIEANKLNAAERLRDAAQDMLAVLEKIRNEEHSHGFITTETLFAMKDAIAKARGAQ